MSIRFHVVRSDADQPWHTRIIAGNSRKWFASEQYATRASALKAAVNLVVGIVQPVSYSIDKQGVDTYLVYTRTDGQNRAVRIEEIDER